MTRVALTCPLLVLCLLLCRPAIAQADEDIKKHLPGERLYKAVELNSDDEDFFKDPATTVQAALDRIAKKGEFDYRINDDAFEAKAGGTAKQRLSAKLKEGGPFSITKDVTLATLLNDVLARMPGEGEDGATFLLRADHIEITTRGAARLEIYPANFAGPFMPLVNVDFDQVPLPEALKELVVLSGIRVKLDPHTDGRSKRVVTLRLKNTPVDTAVRLVADQADLTSLRIDYTLSVTTFKRAATVPTDLLGASDIIERLSIEYPTAPYVRASRLLRPFTSPVVFGGTRAETHAMYALLGRSVTVSSDESEILKDKKATVRDAMDWLALRWKFAYEVNERAFEGAGRTGSEASLNTPFLKDGAFEVSKDTALGTLLQRAVSRMPGKGADAATYLVRRDHIEITTVAALRRESYGPMYKGPFRQVVSVDIKKQRLDEAVGELADNVSVNIVIDPRAEAAARERVTLQLANMDIDDVLRILASMAGMRVYHVDNVFVLAMPQHVREMDQRDGQRQRGISAPQ